MPSNTRLTCSAARSRSVADSPRTSHITMCLIICFLLGSLHRRTVRASVIVDREQGEVVQQQTDIEYLKPACHSTGNALLHARAMGACTGYSIAQPTCLA